MKEDLKTFGTGWVFALLSALGVLAILFVVWGATTGWRYWSADVRGKTAAREQIKSGPSRIAAYNHFFDLCASVQTKEATIVALRQELGTNPDDARRQQIQASITANRAGRADDVNQYNQDARKGYTIGQFRSLDLPYQLDLTKEKTTCVA